MSAVLTLGSTGAEVGSLHQSLIEAGEQIDAGELRQAFFGPSTKIAVMDFQANHLAVDGQALKVDGVVGQKTTLALLNPRQPTEVFEAPGWKPELEAAQNHEAQLAARAAIGEIGVKEVPPGSNRGPRVDVFTGEEWYGSPWCALFVSWCWGRTYGGSPFGVKASALKLHSWATTNRALLPQHEAALPGDLGIILRAGGRGHVELVVARERFGEPLSLVGGNVANSVRGTVRPRSAFSHLIRPLR